MSWFNLFQSKESSREKAINRFNKLVQKSIDDMLNECNKHKRIRLKYSFSSHRGRMMINAFSIDGKFIGTWPQPIEGYDYPTGTLPKVK